MKTVEEQVKERTTQELVSTLKDKQIYVAAIDQSNEFKLGTLEQIKSSFIDDGYIILDVTSSAQQMEMTIEDDQGEYQVDLFVPEICDQCWHESLEDSLYGQPVYFKDFNEAAEWFIGKGDQNIETRKVDPELEIVSIEGKL